MKTLPFVLLNLPPSVHTMVIFTVILFVSVVINFGSATTLSQTAPSHVPVCPGDTAIFTCIIYTTTGAVYWALRSVNINVIVSSSTVGDIARVGPFRFRITTSDPSNKTLVSTVTAVNVDYSLSGSGIYCSNDSFSFNNMSMTLTVRNSTSFGPPNRLSVAALNHSSVNLTWSPPSPDSICITQYIISRDDIPVTTTSTNTLVLSHLSYGNTYNFTVAAVDKTNTTGNYSQHVIINLSVPNVVRNLNYTSSDDGIITVYWNSPVNNYHPDIIHYIIYTNMTDTSHVTITSDITNYTLSGMSTGSTYFISVSAVNTIGEGTNNTIYVSLLDFSPPPSSFPQICPKETDAVWNIAWLNAIPNTTQIQACPGFDSLGNATRHCDINGNWLSVDVSMCQSRSFIKIQQLADIIFAEQIDQLNHTEINRVATQVTQLVNQLNVLTNNSVASNTPLFPLDLSIANNVLNGTVGVLNASLVANNFTAVVNETAMIDILSDLLDTVNIPGWLDLQETDPKRGSELLLSNSERYGLYLAEYVNNANGDVLSRKNIVVSAKQLSVDDTMASNDTNLTFPNDADLVNFLFENSTNTTISQYSPAIITIPNSLILERSNDTVKSGIPVVNILFNNLQVILENTNIRDAIQPGTVVLSSQVGFQRLSSDMNSPSLQTAADPVNITFTLFHPDFTSPSCVFWDFSNPIGQGSWSTVNIKTDNSSSPLISCLSSHLTSFAVLVDVAGSTTVINPIEEKVLSVLTYTGLVISMVFLLLTIIFFICLQIYQKKFSVLNFVHANLSLCLLMAYIVFISGIETAIGNKMWCTIVAVILHYLFLSVFFWMLSEGVLLYLMLVVVFTTLTKRWWFFFILGWVPGIFPVAITVGIANNNYVNETQFCWLSSSSHIIWSFVVPMIIIVIINTVFLVMVIVKVIKNSRMKKVVKAKSNKRVDLVKAGIKASVILLPLLGITWVIGLFAINQGTSTFAWFFVICNTLQGAAIFIFHVIRNDLVWSFITKTTNKFISKDRSWTDMLKLSGKDRQKDPNIAANPLKSVSTVKVLLSLHQ